VTTRPDPADDPAIALEVRQTIRTLEEEVRKLNAAKIALPPRRLRPPALEPPRGMEINAGQESGRAGDRRLSLD
jgi:hypothetical protein